MLASPPGEGFEIPDAAGRIGDRLAIHHPRSSRGAPPTVRITGIDAMHSDTPTLDFTAEKTLRSSIEKILRHLDLWPQEALSARAPPGPVIQDYVIEPILKDCQPP